MIKNIENSVNYGNRTFAVRRKMLCVKSSLEILEWQHILAFISKYFTVKYYTVRSYFIRSPLSQFGKEHSDIIQVSGKDPDFISVYMYLSSNSIILVFPF